MTIRVKVNDVSVNKIWGPEWKLNYLYFATIVNYLSIYNSKILWEENGKYCLFGTINKIVPIKKCKESEKMSYLVALKIMILYFLCTLYIIEVIKTIIN